MGLRGPVPKRSDQRHGHRTKAEIAQIEKHYYSRCALPGCDNVAGHARYGPNHPYCGAHWDHD